MFIYISVSSDNSSGWFVSDMLVWKVIGNHISAAVDENTLYCK